jgi:hypothetical protein
MKALTLADVLPLTPEAIKEVEAELKNLDTSSVRSFWFCPQCDFPNDFTAGACSACNLEKE